MGNTNYPNGFANGLTVRGVPILNTYAGNIFWLDSGIGSDGNRGKTKDKPFATLDYAVSQCTANNGDIIIVAPGHAETIATATALAIDVAGVHIVGLGTGALRPTFTVGTLDTATITFSAANCSCENIIVKSNLDGLNTAVTVSGTGVYLDIEHQDASSTVEADIAIAATGDQFTCKLRDIGFTDGDQRDQSITLNGVDNARIDIDFYGKVVIAVVNMITAACADVEVKGTMYVSGTTDLSKNVVDTITGSTWSVKGFDAAAGAEFSGGSGNAIAAGDLSAIASNVSAILVDSDLQEKTVLKAAAVMVNGDTLFTVAGGSILVEGLVSECVTANDATASTLQYSATPTVGAATTISGATTTLASVAAGYSISLLGTALSSAPSLSVGGPNLGMTAPIVVPAGTITIVIAAGSTTGTWKHYIRYCPLATGVTVS